MKSRRSDGATAIEVVPYGMRAQPDDDEAKTAVHAARPKSEPALVVGGDDAFILAWGRNHEALRSRSRQLLVSMALNCAFVALVGYLAWRNEQKETYVFVRDTLGNIVQADAQAFLRAGDRRTEVEIKGFMRRWVLDAFSWTPLDVEDRWIATRSWVDSKSHGVLKHGLRLGDRRRLVEDGFSGRVMDDAKTGREPQVVIVRTQPLEVMVSLERYVVDTAGETRPAGQTFVRALLRQVPRAPANPSGLVISDIQISEKL